MSVQGEVNLSTNCIGGNILWYKLLWCLSDKYSPTSVGDVGQEDTLAKEMETHSSNLAWEIPWIEELGGPQSMGSQRVEHDLGTKQ